MGLKPITAPPVEPLTLADAYVQCQIDTTTSGSPPVTTSPHDAWLMATIPVVRQQAENELSRALITQTWELSMHDFPRPLQDDITRDDAGWFRSRRYRHTHDWRVIRIPLPPLQSVTSIVYIDTDNNPQTLDPSTYFIDDTIQPAQITPSQGNCWPSTNCQPNSVKVRFVCGYLPTLSGSPPVPSDYRANVPPALKHWMLLVLGNWFRNREATWQVVSSQTLDNAPYVDAMLFPFRVLGQDV